MTDTWEDMAQEGIRFFGKMTASLSHEIKNALAIINEKAGLLEDFTLMAGQGRPIDPERLKTLASEIIGQVRRADTLVKRLNRFAHSADEPVRSIDLGEALDLIITIAQRPAAMAEAVLEAIPPASPIPVITKPFILEHLIWTCVDFLLKGKHKTIRLRAENNVAGPRIRFIGDFPFTEGEENPFPGAEERMLLQVLQADLRMEPSSGEMVLHLPKGP